MGDTFKLLTKPNKSANTFKRMYFVPKNLRKFLISSPLCCHHQINKTGHLLKCWILQTRITIFARAPLNICKERTGIRIRSAEIMYGLWVHFYIFGCNSMADIWGKKVKYKFNNNNKKISDQIKKIIKILGGTGYICTPPQLFIYIAIQYFVLDDLTDVYTRSSGNIKVNHDTIIHWEFWNALK